MANQSDRTGHNFNQGSAMQQPNTASSNKADVGKNKTNPNYKGDQKGKSSKGDKGCC
jgi:hypothetical protein